MHTHTSQSTNTSANWAMATQKLASLRKVVSAKLRGRGRRPSLGTRHKYVKAFRRMRTQRKTPKDYIGSKNTFYFMRAAWTWGVLRDMSAEIRSIGRVIRPDNEALVAAAICRAHDLIEDLNRHKPDPGHKNRDNVELVGEFTQLTDGRRQTLASKRRELKSLPLCWRDQTVAAAWLADSSYLLPIATESAVGPRPAELARGVRVSLDEDGNLVFTIAGAKYREGEQGQEWRKITCPVQALDTQIVRDAVIAAGRELLIVAPSAKGMWSAVNYFAKQAFSGHDYHISPYSMRHQVGADLKGEGWPPATIAMALGHQTDRTSGVYGRPNLAKGGRNFVVEASDTVRKTMWHKIVASRPQAIASIAP